jgi:DhnA family fructose-bisphosphate aldolase class Ia
MAPCIENNEVYRRENVMTGRDIRLQRLLGDNQNAVVVAIDHGQTFGPMPGLTDFTVAAEMLHEADGVLLAPAMIRFTSSLFSVRGSPCIITRLNWTTRHCVPWDYQTAETVYAMPAREAARRGAEIVLASLILKTGSEAQDALNVENFARLAIEAHAEGLPIIGEVFPPAGIPATAPEFHNIVKAVCRIACELGADAIKTFYTGDSFPEVVQGTPIPVLALGAEKLAHEVQALALAEKAVRAGARGIVFGRNVVQAQNPARFLRALRAVAKEGASAEQAAREFALDAQ